MEIKEDNTGLVTVLIITGRVEMVQTAEMRESIFTQINNSDSGLLLDLSALDYINSMGLGIFIRAAKEMNEKNRRLVFCSLKENIAEIFEIAGFTKILQIFNTKEEALASFKKDSP